MYNILLHDSKPIIKKIGDRMTRTIHRWANTLAILIVMYFLYQISVSAEEKDVKQCEYLLMEELGSNK
jgi:hypothetical protein